MRSAYFYILAGAVIVGCSTVQVRGFTVPDGKPALSLRCGEMSQCYQQAIEMCVHGYNIVGRTSNTLGVPTSHGGLIMVPNLSVQISCKSK